MSNSKQEVAQQIRELFEGKVNAYAEKFIDKITKKKGYRPARTLVDQRDLPFNAKVCEKHLKGEISIGVYPFINQEGFVRWAVADFDGKRGNALEDAVAVKKKLQKAGITTWLERSQSGNGVHLWLFTEEPVPAKALRRILGAAIEEYDVERDDRETSFDMVIPDTDVPSGDYGKLCALPLNGTEAVKDGRTAFIDDQGNMLLKQTKALSDMLDRRNKTQAILQLASKIKPTTKEEAVASSGGKYTGPIGEVQGGVKIFSPYGCQFLHSLYQAQANGEILASEPEWHAALGQFVPLQDGEKLAHIFSKSDPRYNEADTGRKFKEAVKRNLPMRTETIVKKFGKRCQGNCICKQLGASHPWEIAKVPLTRLADIQKRGQVYTARELADESMEVAKEVARGERMGFPWGYDVLDDATEIRPKNFLVIAARRSVGKTAVMVDTAVRLGHINIPQYIFSIEMAHEQIGLRLLSRVSEIDHTLITTGGLDKDQWKRLEEAKRVFADLPIFVEEYTKHPEKMLDIAGNLIYEYGQGIVWVDYLQMAHRASGEKQKDAVDRAIASLTLMSKILDVPVIALAQLNRDEEKSESDTELDSWLKDSGNIEQDSDVIHYLRGKQGRGPLVRKWRIHKERYRAGGLNFKFVFQPHIYKFTPAGEWHDGADENSLGYEIDDNYAGLI